MRSAFPLALALVLSQPVPAGPLPAQSDGGTNRQEYQIKITDLSIPVRNGVRLHARMWRPLGLDDPGPVILSLTPYTVDDAHERGTFFAKHGYVYVNVDARGRGGSEGEFWPLQQDGPDGHDVVQWVAQQPWCDGRVGMRGGSYRGMVQWQTLRERPSALSTIVPTASVHPGWDYPNPSGIFLSYAARWLAFVNGAASQSSLFGDTDYWRGKYLEKHQQHRPFADLDDLTGLPPRVFQRWIEHPYYDSFWQVMNPGPGDYRTFDLPILTITGYFDGDQPGAMKYYQDHMRHGRDRGKAQHYLVIGPWSHGGTRRPVKELSGLVFGENSVIEMEQLHLDWFNWVFKDGPRPDILRDRVVYYVMQSNEWKHAAGLESVTTDTVRWYLSSEGGRANDVFRSGTLSASLPTEPGVDSYVHDPRQTQAEGERVQALSGSYVSGGMAFAPGPKLVYHSPPLDEALEVSGYVKLEAYTELNVPDTDILAFLYEVRPDGETIYLGRSELRARHRHGVDRADLVTPGKVELYEFDRFYWFSRKLLRGSRLRLVIMPLNTPDRDKNYHSGGNTIHETDQDARTAEVRIHHGPDHPSALLLPVSRDGN
ncbi:MAG: CocE/NonD family hydrolase [Gemmatimonadales bacterium]|nr:CocE/NonD family hydrolase [Gemmatimonadales bacterium]NIN13391.1 CocE/NonD family hydrolase [Gemmatimonadales bacterium]NIN51394.1 CocE/NonD family hydrolase [Gemmatimonadales bacterium]NIP08858.1 CocE/NonD family hydrolase [Gemmatimonadales bacterium]NIQ99852.1 CocE/NonD family hydrolase [Gemmatimonadales bacterium]